MTGRTAPEPLGATLYSVGVESRFTYFSRGDLVHGRMRVLESSQPQPLLLALAPDGASGHPFVDQVFDRWSDWATVASIDLPLCGRRRSDKLSALAFEEGHPVAERLQPDLEEQIESDLGRMVMLMRQKTVGESRVGLIGVGPIAALARPASSGMIASFHAETAVDARWFDEIGTRLRRQLG